MNAKELPRYEISHGLIDKYLGWHIHRISDGHIEKVKYSSEVTDWVRNDHPGSVHIIWYDEPDNKYKDKAEQKR